MSREGPSEETRSKKKKKNWVLLKDGKVQPETKAYSPAGRGEGLGHGPPGAGSYQSSMEENRSVRAL